MKIDRKLLRDSWHSWVASDLRPPDGPGWLQWVWTLLFCATMAVFFTMLAFTVFAPDRASWTDLAIWAHWYGRNLVVCLTVGVLIHLLFVGLRRWPGLERRVDRWQPWQRTLLFSGIPLLGVLVGWPLGMLLAGLDLLAWLLSPAGSRMLVGSLLLSVMTTLVLHQLFVTKSRQIQAERQAAEAQLRLLQAQIEPHFLFNTLANVCSLIEHDGARARQMLEAFTDYLRGSLGALRHDDTTLANELDLARAYLAVLKVRMEDRLQYDIDCPADLADARLPPLLLQPLIENAVQHGLEPAVAGGAVRLRVQAQDDRLVLEVEDNGRGLDALPRPGARRGTGLALANIRERLRAHYGSAAALDLQRADPGTRARLVLPLKTKAA